MVLRTDCTHGVRGSDLRSHAERINDFPNPADGTGTPVYHPQSAAARANQATSAIEDADMTLEQFEKLVDLLSPISEAAKIILAESADRQAWLAEQKKAAEAFNAEAEAAAKPVDTAPVTNDNAATPPATPDPAGD